MPKQYRDRRTFARDINTGLYACIIIHRATRQKFARVGAPRRITIPSQLPPKICPLTLEERISFSNYHEEERNTLSLLSRLTQEKSKLEDRITNSPTPLADRITDPLPFPSIHIPPPIPSEIKFRKEKFLCRIKEFRPMVLATINRYLPLFDLLNEDDEMEWTGESFRVPHDTRNELWRWFLELQRFEMDMNSVGHTLTHAQWRQLKRELKRLGKFELKSLNSQLPEICTALMALDITLPL